MAHAELAEAQAVGIPVVRLVHGEVVRAEATWVKPLNFRNAM